MQFPSTIGFSSTMPASHSPAYINESQSLKTLATTVGAHRWEFELTTTNLKEPQFRQAWAFLNSLAGQAKTFDVALPLFSSPLGDVIGVVQTLASHAIGDNNISVNNYTAEIGDFIRFAGHSKCYMVSATAGSAITLFPPLIKPVLLNEVVSVNNVKFTVRLASKVSKLTVDTKKITKLKFKCIEAF